MQEIRYDDTDHVTEGASRRDIVRALANPENREVRVVRPGGIIERWENGRRKRYRVTDEGKLQRVTLAGDDWPAGVSR